MNILLGQSDGSWKLEARVLHRRILTGSCNLMRLFGEAQRATAIQRRYRPRLSPAAATAAGLATHRALICFSAASKAAPSSACTAHAVACAGRLECGAREASNSFLSLLHEQKCLSPVTQLWTSNHLLVAGRVHDHWVRDQLSVGVHTRGCIRGVHTRGCIRVGSKRCFHAGYRPGLA